jgi:N-acylneuraminate cytidylyltransferase
MYYGENGDEFKKFNTHDGKGFELLRLAGLKQVLIQANLQK